MKQIFSLLAIALVFSSCKEDDPIITSTYPTERLNPSPETNSFVIVEYSSTSSNSANSELIRGSLLDMFPSNLVHLSLISNTGDPLYVPNGDSLSDHFGGKPAGTFLLNGAAKSVPEILASIDEINDNISTKPILSVAHAMSTNDTAWIADILVEFYKDTVTPFLYIESYLVADMEALLYNAGPIDLRLKPNSPLTTNVGEITQWAKDFFNADTTKLLYPVSSTYTHKGVFLGNFNPNNEFGTPLASYTKFGGEYFSNDNIGLQQNPIQHYFLKSDYDHLDFTFKPRIVTVVWVYDFIALDYKYVNSYMN